MRSCAYEIEVADDVIAIVHAEIGALREQRLQAEGGAQMGVEFLLEIRRAEVLYTIVGGKVLYRKAEGQ